MNHRQQKKMKFYLIYNQSERIVFFVDTNALPCCLNINSYTNLFRGLQLQKRVGAEMAIFYNNNFSTNRYANQDERSFKDK